MADFSSDALEKKSDQLEIELQEFRQLFSMSLDLICIADINSAKFLKVNPAFQSTLGYAEEELIDKPFSDFIHPEDIEPTWKMVEEKLRQGAKVVNFDNRYRCKDGSYKWLSWVSHPNPEKGKTYAIARDVTCQKRMTKKLDESKRKYSSLFHNAQVALFRTSVDGQLLEINKRYAEIAGYETVENCMAEYNPKTAWVDINARDDFLKKIQETGSVSDYETKIIRKDGTAAWILFSATIFPDDGYIEGSIVNITDRKQAEYSLRESEARFKALHNASFGGITIHDKGVILDCNQGLSDITGYPFDELIGMNGLLLIAEQSRPLVMEKILSGSEKSYEVIGLRKNGDEYLLKLEARNIPYKGKRVRSVEFRDITEQRKAEQDRERLQNQLSQAQKMESVGRLAAGMAHEINNPLAGVIQNISVLENRMTDQTMPANIKAAQAMGTSMDIISGFMGKRGIPQIVDNIKEAGIRMSVIVENMLSFARKSDSNYSSHDPVALMDKVLVLASTDYDLKKNYDFKSITIEKQYENNLPLIVCEESKFQQVILNVLNNGAHAMFENPKGDHPKFILRLKQEQAPAMLRIEIEDNGPGMDAATSKRIFEPFFTTKPVGVGTGLGLSVSYFIITENHNGSMEVRSESGIGSTFIIRLPVG